MPPPEARSADPPDLDLLRNWREPASPGRILRAGIGSILVHIVAVIVFLSLPEVVPSTQAPAITADLRRAVHLVAPRNFEPTQKAPNPSKARPELDVRSSLPAPQSLPDRSLRIRSSLPCPRLSSSRRRSRRLLPRCLRSRSPRHPSHLPRPHRRDPSWLSRISDPRRGHLRIPIRKFRFRRLPYRMRRAAQSSPAAEA